MIIIKTPEEIKLIREACRVTAQVLLDIEKEIKEGLTTEELDRFGESQILKYGCLPAFKGYRGYRHSLCISVDSEVVHGIPGPRKLKIGDIVSVDVGAIYRGYYGDSARTFKIGKVSSKAEKLIQCTRESLKVGIANAKCGGRLGDISHSVEEYAKKHSFSVVRDLFGHGVGKNLHEDPLIPNYGQAGTGPELRPGMVLAIEPMLNAGGAKIITLDDGWTVVTADRSLSAHFEDTILINKDSVEVLTKA